VIEISGADRALGAVPSAPMLRRLLCASIISCAIGSSLASNARADDPSAVATAEALFAEGRKLMADGQIAVACPKFEAAQRLAPTPGTLLNLANCYEKAGRIASAWASYRDAISSARAAGRTDLAESAQKRAGLLEPRLARLSVTVTASAPGVAVMRDNVALPREGWAVPVPVDPGEHVVTAQAPGRRPFRAAVPAPAEGATTTVNVPELEVDPAATTPAPEPSPVPAATPSVAAPPSTNDGPKPGATQRTLGVVAGGVGVVGLVIGGGFAAQASSKNSDSKAKCRPEAPNLCTPEGKSLRDDAQHAGDLATVSVLLGALFAGAGAALYFTAPSDRSPRAAQPMSLRRVGLGAGPSPVGVGLAGVFE